MEDQSKLALREDMKALMEEKRERWATMDARDKIEWIRRWAEVTIPTLKDTETDIRAGAIALKQIEAVVHVALGTAGLSFDDAKVAAGIVFEYERVADELGQTADRAARILAEVLDMQSQLPALQAPTRRPKPQPIADKDGHFKMPSDRINQSMILALTPGAMRRAADIGEDLDGLSAQGLTRANDMRSAYVFGYKDGTGGAIGFFEDPGDVHWAMIQKNGELAIRLQCALWAHAYAETGGEPEPGKFVTLNISNLCDSLGYKRHKGAHQKKNKQAVKEGLRALTRQELLVIVRLKNGKAVKLTGPVWTRGLEADTAESYDDLFGSNRVGDPDAWEPATFGYAPGPFFAHAEWREYNKAFALVGQNLLKLQGAHDKWAVMFGGYLASLSKMNGYQPTTLKVKTLLDKSGLQRQPRLGRRVSEMRGHFERALERLNEVGVIASWRFDKTGLSTDEPDGLDEAALDQMHKDSKSDWRDWNVVIEWPEKLTEIGTQHQQQRKLTAIAAKKRDRRLTNTRQKA